MPAQKWLLEKGLNFAITPKHLPTEAYIAAIEETCTKLNPGEAEELRAETSTLLKQKKPQHPQHHQGRI